MIEIFSFNCKNFSIFVRVDFSRNSKIVHSQRIVVHVYRIISEQFYVSRNLIFSAIVCIIQEILCSVKSQRTKMGRSSAFHSADKRVDLLSLLSSAIGKKKVKEHFSPARLLLYL